VKVVNDVKGVYTTLLEEKKGGKKLGIAETALGKYCGKKLSTKDNKLVRVVGGDKELQGIFSDQKRTEQPFFMYV
jgi:hypothetical protein